MADQPRVFISYAHQDGETFANALRRRLEQEQPEITLWQDLAQLEGGIGWWRQITEALDNVEFLVLILTPAAVHSPIVRQEWRYARQRGVCVYPVIGATKTEFDYRSLPKWMRKVHFFDLEREWNTFVNYLKSPCLAARVSFMAPDLPRGYVERPTLTERLLGMLMDQSHDHSAAINIALYGAGGLGKSTLAAALCHKEDIIGSFDDGILWVTLGQNPNIQDNLTKLYAALSGLRPDFVDKDGKFVVSYSDDCTVKLWRLIDLEWIATFTGDSPMKACALGEQGLIIAGDRSGCMHFVNIEDAK